MRLSCQQDEFQRALGYVGRAVARKSTLPVLGNVLLSAENGSLRLAATNLEIAITAQIDADVSETGAVTVRSDLLGEFISSLPNDLIKIELDRRSLNVGFECARSKAHIKGIPAEDFPSLPSVDTAEPMVRVDPQVLREMITQVAFAAASDDSRPVLAGVLVNFEGQRLIMAAADGFRLSVRESEFMMPVDQDTSIIVPARALQELSRILSDQSEPVDISITPNQSQILIRAGTMEFHSRLIDGNFPDFRQIIPRQYSTRMVLSRDDFLAAARRAKLFAQSSNDVVRIQMNPGDGDLDPGFATISAQAAETGDNEDYLDARIEGPQSQIAFNGRYLTDVLAVMRGTEVALEMTGPNAAGVLKAVTSDDFTHVIMPMVIGTI